MTSVQSIQADTVFRTGESVAPIRRLLIANRGEIALRIQRSAREMGIETVAVFSTADSDAPHVKGAEQSVCIGPPEPAASYLDIAAIIAAAHKTGADAVHPGYGFLSENPDFARACVEAGLIFVGPPANVIEVMGDKAQAKQFMSEAGLPCIPGYEGESQQDEILASQAAEIGYPLIVKAKAGGGGRGMRVVTGPEQFAQALSAARSEALNAFGDDRMMIERLVRNPRHIEIQVLVDAYGNGVHIGERDCSVQRRHQKLIEEAPAPGIAPALRDRLGSAAVAAAVRLGYTGVGTFEFLLEGDESFYFMEMNTRLQVEHPVTEAISGQDLVAWQLRVAMGERLGITQEDLVFSGHAIEARLCAEDEMAGFLPQSGMMELWQPPQGIRVDHALAGRAEISSFYDSMFAKVIAHGRTREEARKRLVLALRETLAFGVATNRAALIRILEHPAFVAGQIDTGFLELHHAALAPARLSDGHQAVILASAILCDATTVGGRHASLLCLRAGNGDACMVRVTQHGGTSRIEIDDQKHEIALRWPDRSTHRCLAMFDGRETPVEYHPSGSGLFLQWQGHAHHVEDRTYAPASAGDGDIADGRVLAASNGQIIAVMVAAGDLVAPGTPLLTSEAMKMAYTHTASVAGVVESVTVSVGDFVTSGRLLIRITPQDTPQMPKEA